MYYSIKVLLASACILAGAVYAAEGAVPAKTQKPKSQIIVRPGPPVKPTKAAKPNGPQKSDWGTSAGAQR
jgi:hypothetical protein